jgi:hypothetical protein
VKCRDYKCLPLSTLVSLSVDKIQKNDAFVVPSVSDVSLPCGGCIYYILSPWTSILCQSIAFCHQEHCIQDAIRKSKTKVDPKTESGNKMQKVIVLTSNTKLQLWSSGYIDQSGMKDGILRG